MYNEIDPLVVDQLGRAVTQDSGVSPELLVQQVFDSVDRAHVCVCASIAKEPNNLDVHRREQPIGVADDRAPIQVMDRPGEVLMRRDVEIVPGKTSQKRSEILQEIVQKGQVALVELGRGELMVRRALIWG